MCGGECIADLDGDGICDDAPACQGVLDDCGVCNGPGAIFECGCTQRPIGDCDCAGNQLDAVGECGGDCTSDLDVDGVCDDVEVPGCMNPYACNYLSSATDDDGSCAQDDALGVCGGSCTQDLDGDGLCDDVDDCVGAVDDCGICNGPGAIYDCGCYLILSGDCDCEGNTLDALGVCGGGCSDDVDGDGICDDQEVAGCMVAEACNYDASATLADGSCEFTTCSGCTYAEALNYDAAAVYDDGSCTDFQIPDPCPEDVNEDGVIGILDVLEIFSSYGQVCQGD